MIAGKFRVLALGGLLISAGMLSGCVGGTTYGTGVSQEKQTVEDFANLLSFRKKRTNIDYQSRPDLVVPEEKVLVEPTDNTEVASAADWPETPEERIMRIRAEAEEAQKTTAGQIAYARKEKRYRSVVPGSDQIASAPIGKGVPGISCSPQRDAILRQCTGAEISNAVRAQRAEIKSVGKTGYQRRYLTEPPLEYRTPSENAQAGDLGYTEAELKKIEAEEKERSRRESMSGPNS